MTRERYHQIRRRIHMIQWEANLMNKIRPRSPMREQFNAMELDSCASLCEWLRSEIGIKADAYTAEVNARWAMLRAALAGREVRVDVNVRHGD